MQVPTPPQKFTKQGQLVFNGELNGAVICNDERLNRASELISDLGKEVSGGLERVKSDLNGGLLEVRGEINTHNDNLHKRITALYHDVRDKESEFDARIDDLVTYDDHRRVGERFEKMDELLVSRSEKLNDRLKPLERLNTLVIFVSVVLAGIAGTAFTLVNNKIEEIEMLKDQNISLVNQMETLNRTLNRVVTTQNKMVSSYLTEDQMGQLSPQIAPNSNINGEHPL
jgi:hypothetical protein